MKITITVLVVLILLVAGIIAWKYGAFGNGGSVANTYSSPDQSSQTSTPAGSGAAQTTGNTLTVNYTASGFSPGAITVHKGDTVTWVNQSSGDMWVASAVHPTHTLYSGTSMSQHCPDTAGTAFDACAGVPPGQSWSFTFTKVGSWGYHDHLRAFNGGTVTVTQ